METRIDTEWHLTADDRWQRLEFRSGHVYLIRFDGMPQRYEVWARLGGFDPLTPTYLHLASVETVGEANAIAARDALEAE
jgi:hypothetical protein